MCSRQSHTGSLQGDIGLPGERDRTAASLTTPGECYWPRGRGVGGDERESAWGHIGPSLWMDGPVSGMEDGHRSGNLV